MALDLCQIFISAQYLENKLIDFHQILLYAFLLTRSRLSLFTLNSIFWPEAFIKKKHAQQVQNGGTVMNVVYIEVHVFS